MTTAPTTVLHRGAVSPMQLLADGVPLSLLLDLFWGPRSELLLHEESVVPAPREG